jgi:hypothetical protein
MDEVVTSGILDNNPDVSNRSSLYMERNEMIDGILDQKVHYCEAGRRSCKFLFLTIYPGGLCSLDEQEVDYKTHCNHWKEFV